MTTLLVADLDCEVTWSGAPPLPAPVRARIAALGTLMRALPGVTDHDAIELVAPVDPARLTDALPRPRLVVRGAHALAADRVVAWGGTGDPAIARAANDRRLAAAVAARLGDRTARVVTSLDALAAALPDGPWVAKATIAAAGRDRVRRRGRALDDATRTRLARLLARGGALVVEPWLARTLDLGQPGRVEDDGAVTLVAPHRLLCDDTGGFRGIAIGDDPAVAAHADALAAAGRAAGAALADLGYRGPFVVDAFVHAGGLRPVVEINARLTFGWIARAVAARLGPGVLSVGDGAPPPGATPLLVPGADPTSAWFTAASGSPAT